MKMEEILKEVARKNGTTVEKAREEMQKAINEAWGKQERDSEIGINQQKIPHKGEVPTPEELIQYLAEKLEGRV